MFKSVIAAGTLVLVSATATFASGPGEVPVTPPVIPPTTPPEEPFEGPYLGLAYGAMDGSGDYEFVSYYELAPTTLGMGDYDVDGNAWGAFAGYNIQEDNFVYGLELRGLHFNGFGVEFEGLERESFAPNFSIDSVYDLRARAGITSGQALFYAAAGVSRMEGTFGFRDYEMKANGVNIGVGAEYNVSERFFVGADVTARRFNDIESGEEFFQTFSGSLDMNTATVRAGIRF